MSDTAILIIIGVVLALAVVVWLLYLAAGLVLMFMAFVRELPAIVAILMFIPCLSGCHRHTLDVVGRTSPA